MQAYSQAYTRRGEIDRWRRSQYKIRLIVEWLRAMPIESDNLRITVAPIGLMLPSVLYFTCGISKDKSMLPDSPGETPVLEPLCRHVSDDWQHAVNVSATFGNLKQDLEAL